jgi:hypothetical protein
MVKGTNTLPSYQKDVAETFTVNEFCCCLGSLKCGTILIGIIYLILSLLMVSASFSYIPSLEVTNPEITHGQISYEFGIYGIYTLVTLFKASSILWLIVNLALLYGVIHEEAVFVVPWIVWHCVLFILQIIVAAWFGVMVTNYMDAHAVELGSIIVTVIINEALLVYFIVVVNSFYQKLKKAAQGYARVTQKTAI